MANIGYIRVSTVQQHTERQLADQRKALDKIFEDKLSGKDTNRPGFVAMMEYLREGDTLHVHEISRLCRSTSDLLATVEKLKEQGVTVHFHKENIIITGGNESPVGNMVLTVLAGVAQMEREMLLARQREGYQAAKAAGRIAARGKGKAVNRPEIIAALAAGGSVRKVAAQFEVSTRTVQNIKGEMSQDD